MIGWINKKRNKKGFTLIELIVVVAILGILAALAVPRFAGTQKTSRVRTHNANIRTIESAVALHQAEEGSLPADIDALVTKEYLQAVPVNPLEKDDAVGYFSVPEETGVTRTAIASGSAATAYQADYSVNNTTGVVGPGMLYE